MVLDAPWMAMTATTVSLLLAALIVAGEAALQTVSRATLEPLAADDDLGAQRALALMDQWPRVQSALSVIKLLLVVVAIGSALASWPGRPVTVLLLISLVLLVGNVLAAALGRRAFRPLAPLLSVPLRWLALLASPLTALLDLMGRRLDGEGARAERQARDSEEEGRVLAQLVGNGGAQIPPERREMIARVVGMAGTTVREVMVPRPDIVALEVGSSMLEALDLTIREGHSRIPVYSESIDKIEGVLYAKDLLAYLRDGRTSTSIRDMLRPALFVPDSKMADELLHDLKRRHVHLAIIFDEYGGTAGIVTIEDILEEIVGEIQDEYDAEEAAYVQLGEREALVSSRLDIDDLNYRMGLSLPTDENDTVGGLVYSSLGRVPLVGDEFRLEEAGVAFRVVAMVGRRISSVRIMVDDPDTPAEETPETATERTGSHTSLDGGEMGLSNS